MMAKGVSYFVTASMSINPFLPPDNPKLSKIPKIMTNIERFFKNTFSFRNKFLYIKAKNNTIKVKFIKCINRKLLSNQKLLEI